MPHRSTDAAARNERLGILTVGTTHPGKGQVRLGETMLIAGGFLPQGLQAGMIKLLKATVQFVTSQGQAVQTLSRLFGLKGNFTSQELGRVEGRRNIEAL